MICVSLQELEACPKCDRALKPGSPHLGALPSLSSQRRLVQAATGIDACQRTLIGTLHHDVLHNTLLTIEAITARAGCEAGLSAPRQAVKRRRMQANKVRLPRR